jgi:hypothetical protein
VRLRSWVIWFFLPVLFVALAIVVLLWQPAPREQTFASELKVGDQRIALPLQTMRIDELLDGGSQIYVVEDAAGVMHEFTCRHPEYTSLWHLSSAAPTTNRGYGNLITADAEVRNLLYYSGRRLGADGSVARWLMLGRLYPSLFHRWVMNGK